MLGTRDGLVPRTPRQQRWEGLAFEAMDLMVVGPLGLQQCALVALGVEKDGINQYQDLTSAIMSHLSGDHPG